MITLTSDFGLKDPYVAEMKGVILTINSKATIVDVTHGIEKFNIRLGAFRLASAAPYFPKDTVHVAVVDPGVGTKRRPILVQTGEGFFVGPDNGVLMLAAQGQKIEHVYELSVYKFMLPHISGAFHGRDIFAPVAAHLDKGVRPEEFGPELHDPTIPKFAMTEHKNGIMFGEVLDVDSFGNAITNIPQKEVGKVQCLSLKLHEKSIQLPFVKAYAEVKLQEPAALIGSHGFLELTMNQGNFSKKYRIDSGDRLEITIV